MASEKTILAGGCFWGMEELIRELPGVTHTVVGYTGGNIKMLPIATTAHTPKPSP